MLKPTIGCEVHCELKTATKLFCGCKNEFGGEPNTHCCPICSGFPGTLPTLNERAVEYAVKAGLALGCTINKFSKWDRKNYFYPDLPKAWQTSQYDLPLCVGGYVEFELNGETKRVRLNRIHLEEDAGKLVHDGGVSRVDYNRCGVPLIEIVTEPDMHSADEVVAFLTALKSVLKYTGVSDVKMQEGSLRCDVNLSVAEEGAPLGTRTETKNLNSFRAVARSVLYETRRQIEVIESGGKVEQETRRFDDARGVGYAMRSKEDAHDYRYFPEPDLLPVVFTDERIEEIAASIPSLPKARKERYVTEYGLPRYDAEVLTIDKEVSDLFDGAVAAGADPKKTSNFIMSEVLRLAKTDGAEDADIKISATVLAEIVKMQAADELNNLAAKSLLSMVWGTNDDPREVAKNKGLIQSNDEGAIKEIFDGVIAANASQVNDFLNGNDKLRGYFVGQVMRAAGGKANPKIINALLDALKENGK
ncbi:MAG: Asp-tRNA(Asn)/Glu-tRNA(Gln) amidotransferase subunit GatB [Clostridiales bacterium]|nr:Asp-tRNA(Asn)/Glu-tRNA(Gln) amidotransferase subunit GatB [Clostridiales bacterium]